MKLPVSIAMVAYNEETTIEYVIKEYYNDVWLKLPRGSEFLLYLDKPTDGTIILSRKLVRDRNIRIIEGKANLGYAGAMKNVLKETKNAIVFYSDTSGKHRASDFWQLFPYIHTHDIVTGDRIHRTDPIVRQALTWLHRLLVVCLFRVPFYDYNTGFKIVRKKVLDTILHECRYTKQSFSTELMIRAIKKGYSAANIPVHFSKRPDMRAGTNYSQLPLIVFLNIRGMFLLWYELRNSRNETTVNDAV